MRLRWLGSLLLFGVVACGGDDGTGDNAFPGAGTTAGGITAGTSSGGGTPGGTSVGGPAPIAGGTASGGNAAGSSPGGGTTAGTSSTATGSVPCDVQKILKDKCQVCHTDPPVGAPMPLVSLANFQAMSTIKTTDKMYQRVHARINETGATSMPPPGRPALTAAEKATLDAWVSAGAKASTTACSTGTTSGGTGGTTAGTAGGATAGGSATGGLGNYTPPDSECDYIQDLLAHGGQNSGDTTPYDAPTGGDHYEQFFFVPKWSEKVHTIRIDPVTDNGAVLHHWLLYMQPTTGGDGSHASDIGLQSADSQLLSGWAPGNDSIPLGHDIGLETINSTNGRFAIEIHYNTAGNPANRKDRSGARVCVTKKLRTHEASVHWLGTQAIVGVGKFDAGGTCTVPKESHIIAMSPHMHKTGIYMKTIVAKKAGGMETITDMPFSFQDQQIFPIKTPTGEIVVQPGDVITTTCSYDSPGFITFGPNTGDEMCYNFVVAWPAGSLSNGTGIVGGKNTCMDGI